ASTTRYGSGRRRTVLLRTRRVAGLTDAEPFSQVAIPPQAVVFYAPHDAGVVLRRQGPDDAGGHAHGQHRLRDRGPCGRQRPRCHSGPAPDAGAREQDVAHADQGLVLDHRAMDNRAVADGDPLAHLDRIALIGVHDDAVLDVAVFADA